MYCGIVFFHTQKILKSKNNTYKFGFEEKKLLDLRHLFKCNIILNFKIVKPSLYYTLKSLYDKFPMVLTLYSGENG